METTSQVTMRKSPTVFHLVMLNAIVCGLQFCSSAGFTYIPPMLLKAGLPERFMSIILGLGPLLGFFLVPVIGRASDNCNSRYGRRKPFILGLSVIVIVSLVMIPYGEMVSTYTFGKSDFAKTFGIVLLIIGVILLDFGSEACLTPCEALLSDCCKNTTKSEKAFTYYTFMVSLGGCIGYLMAALDWRESTVGLYFGGQEQSAFSLLIVLFTVTMGMTLFTATEVQNRDLAEETQNNNVILCPDVIVDDMKLTNQSIDQCDLKHPAVNGTVSSKQITDFNSRTKYQCEYQDIIILAEKNCTTPLKVRLLHKCQSLCSVMATAIYNRLPTTVQNLINIPYVLRPLIVTNFFSWSAVMCFNLFYTDFVGQAIFDGNPGSDSDDLISMYKYDEGVRMASWGLLFHCITSAVYGVFFIEKLAKCYGIKKLYIFGNISFVLSMIGMLCFHNITIVNILAAMTGFAFATLTTLPFWLITQYHENKELYFYDAPDSSKLNNTHGIGTDVASIDSAFFLAQVLLSAFMGYIVDHVGTVQVYIMVAALMGLISTCFVPRVIFDKQQMAALIRKR